MVENNQDIFLCAERGVQAQGEDERGQEEGGGAEVNTQRSRDLWRTDVLLVTRGRRACGTQAWDIWHITAR